MRAPISCVFLKRAPTSDSNGRLLTVKPYDFVADLEQCENVIDRASSWTALRSSSSACSRRFIEKPAFRSRLKVHVTRHISPVLKLLRAHHEPVYSDGQGARRRSVSFSAAA